MEAILRECGADASILLSGTFSGPLLPVATVVRAEFVSVQQELDNVRMISLVKRGLQVGKVCEGEGGLDISNVSWEDLEAGIAIGRGVPTDSQSKLVRQYMGSAVYVLNLRSLVLKNNWESVANAIVVSPRCAVRSLLRHDTSCVTLFSVPSPTWCC